MVLTKGTVDEDKNYLFPKELELTFSDIQEFIDDHKSNLKQKYLDNLNWYKAKPPKTNNYDDSHNHLIVNMDKYLIDTLNGFFVGIPPTIKADEQAADKKLQNWLTQADFTDELSELSKQASLYGRSYLLVYNDENKQTKVTVVPPYSAFIIYDDTVINNPLAFIQYAENNNDEEIVTVYDNQSISTYINGKLAETRNHLFNNVPAVEFYDNTEKTGLTDGVHSLIEALNRAISNKADDVDYFADAYLKIINADIDDNGIDNIRKKRIIILNNTSGEQGNPDTAFLNKPDADATQEHLIDRITNLIFQISMVANINDEIFGNATSGRSLEYKLLSMRNLTSNKERKFTKQLRKIFQIVSKTVSFDVSQQDISNNIQFQFVRNLPNNNADEANTAKTLDGIVSKQTQLSTLSIVSDPQAEIKQIQKEKEEAVKRAVETQSKLTGSDINNKGDDFYNQNSSGQEDDD